MLLVMCHLCSIHYKSNFVVQGIGKWRCVSKNNSNLTLSKVHVTASLHFSVWILGLLFEDHRQIFKKIDDTAWCSSRRNQLLCVKEEKRKKIESIEHACRTFLVRVAGCTNTGKVVDFVSACSMVLTRIRSTIIDVCWTQYIIVSKMRRKFAVCDFMPLSTFASLIFILLCWLTETFDINEEQQNTNIQAWICKQFGCF